MLKCYRLSTRTFINGEEFDYYNKLAILDENAKIGNKAILSIDDINKFTGVYHTPFKKLPFVRSTYSYDKKIFLKEKNEVEYRGYLREYENVTMEELMSLPSKDVIPYLKERGLTFCPIIKSE